MTERRAPEEYLACLRRDPYLHLYEIGDLDPQLRPYTTWYGDADGVVMVYDRGRLPVVLALNARRTLERVVSRLPDRFYGHLTPGTAPVLAEAFALELHGRHHKMKLSGDGYRTLVVPSGARARSMDASDLDSIRALLAEAYPANWFDERMLETGRYFGLFDSDSLCAMAGVHVYSPALGVAAVGNVAVPPGRRGLGFGAAVTAEVCRALKNDGIDIVGLNVGATNHAAIQTYRRVGFEFHAEYEEYMAVRSRPRAARSADEPPLAAGPGPAPTP